MEIESIAQRDLTEAVRKTMTMSDGFVVTGYMRYDSESSTADADCYTDEQVEAWKRGDWQYVSLLVIVSYGEIELGTSEVFGFEEGSFPGDDGQVVYLDPLQDDDGVLVLDVMLEALTEARATLAGLAGLSIAEVS